MGNYTEKLSDFIVNLNFGMLPEKVVSETRRFTLDSLGTVLAGYTTKQSRLMVNLVDELGGNKVSTILGVGKKTSPPLAAAVNSVMAHSVELDDTHTHSVTHVGCVVVPTALAVAELVNANGKELIAAIVAGYEAMTRIGMAVMPTHYNVWHSTSTNGTFGAAATAGRLLGLNREEMVNALGLAGTQAAGLIFVLDCWFTKNYHAGRASLAGILSALLAQKGADGPRDILESERGYCSVYSREPKLEKVTDGLGSTFELVERGSYKAFSCLRAAHSTIQAILEIVNRYDIKPEDVERVVNRTYRTVVTHFSNYKPTSEMAAKLSVPFCMAVAFVKRSVGLDDITDETCRDSEVLDMLKKIKVVEDPELTKLHPEKYASEVEVFTHDGKRYVYRVDYPKGDPKNPMSEGEIVDKFRNLASRSIEKEAAEEVIRRVAKLEEVGSIRELVELMC